MISYLFLCRIVLKKSTIICSIKIFFKICYKTPMTISSTALLWHKSKVLFSEFPRKNLQQELKKENFTEQMPLFAILTFTILTVRVNQRLFIDWKKRPSFFTFAKIVPKRKIMNDQCRGNFLLGPKSDERSKSLDFF